MRVSKKYKILVLSHFYKRAVTSGGPPQEIRDYFLPQVEIVSYIEHPFPYSDVRNSSMSIYKNGKLEKRIFAPSVHGPDWLRYILNIIFTFYFYIRAPFIYNLCVALDNLNTFSVLPLRKLNLIKRLVFYTIDYTPLRFRNKILNSIYHFVDRIACYSADAIWILSKRMISARKKNGVDYKKMAPNIILPMGANLSRIKRLPIERISRHKIIFAGVLLKKQGVQLILQALPKIISKIPDVNFTIIGKGEYEKELINLVKSLGIENYVDFKGFIESHTELEKLLCQSAVGVAPYLPGPENYTTYTDPGKPKLYLACGLPTIITDMPAFAKEIKKYKAGVVIKYETHSAENALIKLLSRNALYRKYRENAVGLSKKYDTNSLIQAALRKTN